MQVFLKFPQSQKTSFPEYIILEFQGKIENNQENYENCNLGTIEKLSETVK